MTFMKDSPQQSDKLHGILEDFLHNNAPHVKCTVLTARDGICRAHVGVLRDEAEQLCAAVSGIYSSALVTSPHAGTESADIFEILTRGPHHNFLIVGAGPGSILAVRTTPDADLGNVGHEMAQLVKSVREHFATPAREPATQPAGPGQ